MFGKRTDSIAVLSENELWAMSQDPSNLWTTRARRISRTPGPVPSRTVEQRPGAGRKHRLGHTHPGHSLIVVTAGRVTAYEGTIQLQAHCARDPWTRIVPARPELVDTVVTVTRTCRY